MEYVSTRGGGAAVTAARAVADGAAPDGGLYAPAYFPGIYPNLPALPDMPYASLAFEILGAFLTGFGPEDLKDGIERAYANTFDGGAARVVSAGGSYFLELFNGPTLAFKDVALALLPFLLKRALSVCGVKERPVVLTATSGDTGKAALEAFAGADGVYIAVFYPTDGVSVLQKLQMQTQEGANVLVAGIDGNFDDAQTAVKKVFAAQRVNAALNAGGLRLASANSINIGRLLPQIVYYYHAYGQMCASGAIKRGEPLDFTVPTGNFGNILAGWYAKQTGLPIGRLICASNANNVLSDFFNTRVYDKNRPFYKTSSPSMDILVSSNLERFLFHTAGAEKTAGIMRDLSAKGRFELTSGGDNGVSAAYADETEAAAAVKRVYERGYLIDPHTAVAVAAYEKLERNGNKNVFVATASPYKFAPDVYAAITGEQPREGEETGAFESLELLSGLAARIDYPPAPPALTALKNKPVLHKRVCGAENISDEIMGFLRISQ